MENHDAHQIIKILFRECIISGCQNSERVAIKHIGDVKLLWRVWRLQAQG